MGNLRTFCQGICVDILRQILEKFSQLLEDVGNLEKCNPSNAKPLFLSIQRQGFSSFFPAFFKTSSRAGILSIFDRFLVIWGLHLETFGSTFGCHFFRSQKSQNMFFGVLLGPGYLRPLREKGGTGRHLGDIHRRFSPLIKWMSVGTLLGEMSHRLFLCMSRKTN